MRGDYFNEALSIVGDSYILVSMVARRVKMLRHENRPPLETLETPALEDIALREIIEGRITYVLGDVVVLDDIVGLGDVVTRRSAGDNGSGPSTSPLVNAHRDALAQV